MTATYLRISAQIRDQIVSGELAPGDPIPSAAEIMEKYEVARATAQRVHQQLAADGLTESKPGARTLVKTAAPVYRRAEDRIKSGRATGKFMNDGERSTISDAKITSQVPGEVRAHLGLEPGEPAIMRHRITSRDGQVVEISTSWFPAEIASSAPLLVGRERIEGGTSAYIAKCLDTSFDTGIEIMSVRLATREEASELQRPEPLPVMVVEHIASMNDKPMVYEVGLCPPGFSTKREHTS